MGFWIALGAIVAIGTSIGRWVTRPLRDEADQRIVPADVARIVAMVVAAAALLAVGLATSPMR